MPSFLGLLINMHPMIENFLYALVSAMSTFFFVTRYTVVSPRRIDIADKQLSLVYAPLYLLTQQSKILYASKEDIVLYIEKVEKLLYDNHLYVFPKTFKYLYLLQETPNIRKRKDFIYQLNSDYEKLKRIAGYPTNGFFDNLKRLNNLDKLLFLSSFVFGILSIICSSYLVHFIFSGQYDMAFICFLCLLFILNIF